MNCKSSRKYTSVANLRLVISWLAFLTMLLVGARLLAQTPVTTWHYDNARTSANTTETLLTPANVNSKTFGKLFTQPVDGYVSGQPLYLPGVNITGQGIHNVVYVTTMHDSVYAFDADNPNAGPLWMTSIFTYSPAGATSVPATFQKNAGTTGWIEVGIISTPVIDPQSGTIYLVAETYENNSVVHRLHALDVSTGVEKFGGPTTIAATFTQNGTTSTFQDRYQINRPGLLLANGHVYIAFGSNCCNQYSQGWVMSYNATTLRQEGTFDAEPGKTLASIWQKGAGLSADSSGNIYAETGEGYYSPGTNLSESILKLSQQGTSLSLSDWFTPYDHVSLSNTDADMAQSVLILPDQPGPFPHELIAIGKVGTVYVLNRDSMGQLCSSCTNMDTQIVQELNKAVGYESGSPVYWNNTVYFNGSASPVMAYTLNNGLLVVPASVQSAQESGGGHALITANGDSDGILWVINGSQLWALDAITLQTLYTSGQAANGRDKVPTLAHFATPIVADGKVFLGTHSSLVVYGLFPNLSVVSGNSQSATVATTLPLPLTVTALEPYSENTFPGVTVTFTDGGKGGTFNPPTAVTNQTGSASTSYLLPSKSGSYTLTASATGYSSGLFTETAVPGPATTLGRSKGNLQTGPVATPLPLPLTTKAKDLYGNGVSGISISYSDGGAGGLLSSNPVTTDSAGLAPVTYTTPTVPGTVKISASATGLKSVTFSETVTAGPAAKTASTSGNGQSGPPSTQLALPLVVTVTDKYGNVVAGASVSFADGGAGGSFSSNPIVTDASGVASVKYTTASHTGKTTVKGTVSGVSPSAAFTVTVQ